MNIEEIVITEKKIVVKHAQLEEKTRRQSAGLQSLKSSLLLF
jgi:hypothetical protein